MAIQVAIGVTSETSEVIILHMLLKGGIEERKKYSVTVVRSSGMLRNFAIIVRRMDTLLRNALHILKIDEFKPFK